MKVKLLFGWNGNAAGDELTLDPPVADLLIARGIAARIDDPPIVERKVEVEKVQPSSTKRR